MGRNLEVKARFTAKDDASPVVQRVEGRFKQLANYLKGRFVFTAGEAARAVSAVFRQIENAATLATQTETLKRNLASQGIAFDSYIAKLKEVSNSQVSTAALIQSSSKALLLGIPAEQIAELLQIAGASASATGDSVAKSFDDIATGIGRASPMILDNLGIVLKLGPAYEAMATELKKTTDQLTPSEQKQAILNEVLRVGRERVKEFGDAQGEATKKILEGRAAFENLSNTIGAIAGAVGLGMLGFLAEWYGALIKIAGAALEVTASFAGWFQWIPGVGDSIATFASSTGALGEKFRDVGTTAGEFGDKMSAAADVTFNAALGLDKTAAGAVRFANSLGTATGAADGLAGSTKTASDAVTELGRALGVLTTTEVSAEIAEIEAGLAAAAAELDTNSREYVRLEEIARDRIEALRDNLDRLRDGLAGVAEETTGAVDGVGEFGSAARDAGTDVDALTRRNRDLADSFGRVARGAADAGRATRNPDPLISGGGPKGGTFTFIGQDVRQLPNGRIVVG